METRPESLWENYLWENFRHGTQLPTYKKTLDISLNYQQSVYFPVTEKSNNTESKSKTIIKETYLICSRISWEAKDFIRVSQKSHLSSREVAVVLGLEKRRINQIFLLSDIIYFKNNCKKAILRKAGTKSFNGSKH